MPNYFHIKLIFLALLFSIVHNIVLGSVYNKGLIVTKYSDDSNSKNSLNNRKLKDLHYYENTAHYTVKDEEFPDDVPHCYLDSDCYECYCNNDKYSPGCRFCDPDCYLYEWECDDYDDCGDCDFDHHDGGGCGGCHHDDCGCCEAPDINMECNCNSQHTSSSVGTFGAVTPPVIIRETDCGAIPANATGFVTACRSAFGFGSSDGPIDLRYCTLQNVPFYNCLTNCVAFGTELPNQSCIYACFNGTMTPSFNRCFDCCFSDTTGGNHTLADRTQCLCNRIKNIPVPENNPFQHNDDDDDNEDYKLV